MPNDVIKVLHIDDEESVLEITKDFLALYGIESSTITDPRAARRTLEESDFDVLISDYQMPGMDGLELLASLRKDGFQIPFILLTGKGREDVAIRALNSGVDFYLQKGGDPKAQFAELSNMVKVCSERVRHRRIIDRFTDVVNNVRSGLLTFQLDQASGKLVLSMANPRAKRLIAALQGREGQELAKALPGLFTNEEMLGLAELANGRGDLLKARWEGVLGGKTRHLQIEAFPLPGMMVGVNVNEVTAIAHAEQRMLWAEQKFRSFFESGYLPMILADNETKLIVEVNDRLCDFYGYTREELVGQPAIMLSAEPEATLDTLDKVKERGLMVVHTRYHRRKDGTRIPVQIIGGRLVVDGREMVSGFVLDISDRLKSEARLRSLSKAVENSPTTILITDTQGSIVYVNPKFTALTGYTEDEVLGKKPSILSSGKNPRSLYEEMWGTILAGGTWRGEFSNRKKNGEIYWESASISPIFDEDGKIVNFVAVKEDITKAKALAEQNAFLSDMVTRATNEIYSFDYRTLKFKYVNQSALRNLGYSMDEMRSMTPLDLKDAMPRDLFDGLLEKLRSGREPMVQFETEHRRKDGTRYPVEVHLQLVGPEDDRRFLAIIIDITYRRRMEADLKRLNEKAKVLGALTRHDILNQVTVLKGNLSLMRGELTGPEEKRLDNINNAVRKIESYLEFAAAFEKTGSVSPVWQDLRGLIEESWRELGDGKVAMLVDLPKVEILADSIFPKVFVNLFANSLEHAHGLTTIEVGWEERDGVGCIIYTDDGPGIPDDVRCNLFVKSSGGRRGLGLFLISEVINATNMTISERGEPGKGVRFEILVPKGNWRL
jgi:PAS domain S-box-containing protein